MTCQTGIANLSRRLASGSPDAVATLHRVWFARCVGLVERMTGIDEAAAMDVSQDVLLKAATSMPIFENDRVGEAWLRRVLVNRARDHLRSELRRKRREAAVVARRGTEGRSDDAMEIGVLQDRLARLEEDAADLLRRRFVLGWTLQRIGRELGLGPGAVDGRIRRALLALKGGADVDE